MVSGMLEMAAGSKPRNLLEDLVREGSFKWLLGKRCSFNEEFEEMGRSPSPQRNWIQELSPVANLVVRRCSKVLGVPSSELQECFNAEAADFVKHPSRYARNFLEYCSFRTLSLSIQVTGHLADKKFRRLTYDMMLAWEAPAAASQPLLNVNEDISVGGEAFSRIASAVPIIANVIISENLFEVLTKSTGGRLQFSIYDKYLSGLERSESVVFEFPELKGHTRRDYWLGIIREILYVHRFINKYQIKGVEREEALSKAVLGILRIQAVQDIGLAIPLRCETLLVFNLCDQLPGGDLILESFANMSTLRELDQTNNSKAGGGMYSVSALDVVSNLGFVFGTSSNNPTEAGLVVGEIAVGETSSLERAVRESKNNYEKVVLAQTTIDGVKVDGIDTKLALMKELLSPMRELGKCLLSLVIWDDPVKSSVFCIVFSYIICRGWLGYTFALMFIFVVVFMVLTRFCGQGMPIDEVKVIAPPGTNTMEQLLAVQNAISQTEGLIQDGNIVLLKIRALLLCISPQASKKLYVALSTTALILAFIPSKYIVLLIFVETFTRYSPPRTSSTERWMRRLREWWFSIPAAPVVLEREKEETKRK